MSDEIASSENRARATLGEMLDRTSLAIARAKPAGERWFQLIEERDALRTAIAALGSDKAPASGTKVARATF